MNVPTYLFPRYEIMNALNALAIKKYHIQCKLFGEDIFSNDISRTIIGFKFFFVMKVQQANTKGSIHYSQIITYSTKRTNTIQLLYDLRTIELFYVANFKSYEEMTLVSN